MTHRRMGLDAVFDRTLEEILTGKTPAPQGVAHCPSYPTPKEIQSKRIGLIQISEYEPSLTFGVVAETTVLCAEGFGILIENRHGWTVYRTLAPWWEHALNISRGALGE